MARSAKVSSPNRKIPHKHYSTGRHHTVDVRKLQPVRARLARWQCAIERWALGNSVGAVALDLWGPPWGQPVRPRPRATQQPRARLGDVLHHRLPPERPERFGHRRSRTPVLQDRHGSGAAAQHGVLRRPPTHCRARRLGGLEADG